MSFEKRRIESGLIKGRLVNPDNKVASNSKLYESSSTECDGSIVHQPTDIGFGPLLGP